jgi:hypothetical protein
MSTNINRNLPGDAYDAATNSLSHPSATNAFATMLDLANINNPGNANLLISGGASWSGTGLTFNTTSLVYQIQGVQYSATAQSVTLPVANPTLPRFDAIVVNEAGVVSVISGTPASNPLTPAVGENFVLIQYVLVGAGAAVPTISNEFVYRQGSAPDWLTSSVAGAAPSLSVNFSSTFPVPFEGAQCTLVTAPTYSNNYSLKYVGYTKPSGNILRSTYAFLTFRVNLPVALPARNIIVVLYNNATVIGAILATNWGLNMTSINNWQLVSIPTNAFGNLAITTITSVRFLMTGTTANSFAPGFDRYALDDIKFQSGFGPQINTATIDILKGFNPVASTSKINFIESTGVGLDISFNTLNNRLDFIAYGTGQVEPYYNSPDTGYVLSQGTNSVLLIQQVNLTGNIAVPLNSVSSIEIGSVFKITNIGTGPVNITGAPGVTIFSKSGLTQIESPYGVVTLTKILTDDWLLEGDLI